jgi:fucose permease
MGILFLAPLMLQQVLGLSATESGLVTLAQVIGMMLVMPFAGVLYPRLGPRRMMSIGFVVLAVTIGMFTQVEMETSMWVFRALLFVLGVGMAFTMVPSQTATFETISHEDTANASSLISTTRQIASAAGVALVSSLLASRINSRTAELGSAATPDTALGAAFTAYQDTFLMSAAFAVLGIAAAFLFRNTVAAPPTAAPTPVTGRSTAMMEGAQAD